MRLDACITIFSLRVDDAFYPKGTHLGLFFCRRRFFPRKILLVFGSSKIYDLFFIFLDDVLWPNKLLLGFGNKVQHLLFTGLRDNFELGIPWLI